MKFKSSIWLDFVNYIFMPFYILTLSLELIKLFSSDNIIGIILLVISLLYSIFTLYNFIKRNKIAYYILYFFYILSMILMVIYFSNMLKLKNITYVIEFIIVGIIFWVIPNYVYLYKRKDMFRKHNVAHIKKCPGCNRIIPITMEYCGKCDYKGDK